MYVLSQIEGYKFDPNGEYVRRWLPELSRLPTEWIHHPWNAPEFVLQAAGIELGSNYPLPIVKIDTAQTRLQQALTQMWQHEANSRAVLENGIEEGLGDSTDDTPIAFPQDMQMETEQDNLGNRVTTTIRHYEDQMVPSLTVTTSLFRGTEQEEEEEEESSTDHRNGGHDDRRAEVPDDDDMNLESGREGIQSVIPQFNNQIDLRNINGGGGGSHSPAESSSGTSFRRERDGVMVPVWSPGNSDTSSYLQRHPQSHQVINWRQLSQTG